MVELTPRERTEHTVSDLLRQPGLSMFLTTHQDCTHIITELLMNIIRSRHEYCPPDTGALFSMKEPPDRWMLEVKRTAAKYLDCTSLHHTWLTQFLIKELFDCQMAALSFYLTKGAYPEYHLRRTLNEPYDRIVPSLIGVGYFGTLLALFAYSLDKDHTIWAGLLAGYMVYHYGLKLWQVICRWKMRQKLRPIHLDLAVFHHEVSVIESYDVDTIIRRLTSLENRSFFPFSLLFPLLELRKSEIANLNREALFCTNGDGVRDR